MMSLSTPPPPTSATADLPPPPSGAALRRRSDALFDIKSDTPEINRQHTEIFDMAKSIDQKMDVDEKSIDDNDNEEEVD